MSLERPRAVQPGLKPHPSLRHIIIIASGKGGVGKSTVAVNLAISLKEQGARVGLLDADIYGPSIPLMLGLSDRPESHDQKALIPLDAYGIKVMSIGLLIGQETPMIWRGPMATSALMQLFQDTRWGELDYLLIDLPPGTGDIPLTLAQKIPVAGAIIVTTPQEVAILDARKALNMLLKVEIPVVGVVENMADHHCRQCGHRESLFGSGGGARLAEQSGVALLGALPLEPAVGQQAEVGIPLVQHAPQSETAKAYTAIALKVIDYLQHRPPAAISLVQQS